jgi:hypothetical protein
MLTALLTPTLLVFASVTAAPRCDESVSTQRIVTVTSSESSDRNRSVEIRVENGRIVAKVDGKLLDPSRVRREGDRVVLLGEDGAPMQGVPSVWMAEGGPAKVKVGDNELLAEEIVIEGAGGQITLGPRIRAEMDKALRQVDVAITRASEAGDLLQRFVGESGLTEHLLRWQGTADPTQLRSLLTSGTAEPKVMLGVTLQEPDPALCRHLGLEEGATTLLVDVLPGLPADKAGLRTFDLVVKVDGAEPANPSAIRERISARAPGESIVFDIRRPGGTSDSVEVTLEAFDARRLGPGGSLTRFRLGEGVDLTSALLAPLRDQLRMAPLDALRGDYLFELALPSPPGEASLRWRHPSSAPPEGTAGSFGEPRPALPPGPPHLPPPDLSGSPATAAAAARLERLEARLEEMSVRLERLMDRLESNAR